MKTTNLLLAFIIILSIVLASCSPSEEQIQKAISQTQAAQPTSTQAPTPTATNTAMPTNTPTATSTPQPTSTPKPTATSSQSKSKKEDMILTYSDLLSTLKTAAENWRLSPQDIECPWWDNAMKTSQDFQKGSCHAIAYEPANYGSGVGPIYIQIVTFDNVPKGSQLDGQSMAEGFRLFNFLIYLPETLKLPESGPRLPAGTWLIKDEDTFYLGMPYNNTFTIISYSLNISNDPGSTLETDFASLSLVLLADKQRQKLKEGGY